MLTNINTEIHIGKDDFKLNAEIRTLIHNLTVFCVSLFILEVKTYVCIAQNVYLAPKLQMLVGQHEHCEGIISTVTEQIDLVY